MTHFTTITVRLTDNLRAEIIVEYAVRPGLAANWSDPGCPDELDYIEGYELIHIEHPAGSITFAWVRDRGFLPSVRRKIDKWLSSGSFDDEILDQYQWEN